MFESLWKHLELYEAECLGLLEKAKGFDEMDELALKRFPVLGAYELALKCSHVFNLLDARGAISVTERVGVMARIRTLVVGVAKAYAAQGEALGRRRWCCGGVTRLHPTHREKRDGWGSRAVVVR